MSKRENDNYFNFLSLQIEQKAVRKMQEHFSYEIMKIYKILFKNFSSRRIVTDVKIAKMRLCFNREGFAFVFGNRNNVASYLIDISLLRKIADSFSLFENKIARKKKRKMCKKFLEIISQYELKNKTIFKLKKPKFFEGKEFDSLELDNFHITAFKGNKKEFVVLYFYNKVVEDLARERYFEIKTLFSRDIKRRGREIKILEKILKKLKKQFGKELILAKLEEENSTK